MKIYKNISDMKNDYKELREELTEPIIIEEEKKNKKFVIILLIIMILVLLNMILPIKIKPLVGFGHIYTINIGNKDIDHIDKTDYLAYSFLNILKFESSYSISTGLNDKYQTVKIEDINSIKADIFICTNIYGTNQENCNGNQLQIKIENKAMLTNITIKKDGNTKYIGKFTNNTYKQLLESGYYDIILEGKYKNTKSTSAFKLEVIE